MYKKTISAVLAFILVLALIPSFAAIAELDARVENVALATNGAIYKTVFVADDGTESAPTYLSAYPDAENKLLNDGVTNIGEVAGATVALAGTKRIYRVRFDLGSAKVFNKIVLKNMINSANVEYNGTSAGNRGYIKDAFKVNVENVEQNITVTEKENGASYSMEVTLAFEKTEAQTLYVEMQSAAYVLSLDEIEIFFEEAAPSESSTETSIEETSSATESNPSESKPSESETTESKPIETTESKPTESTPSESSNDTAPSTTQGGNNDTRPSASETTGASTTDPSSHSVITNYALATYGSRYTIVRLSQDGTVEEQPAWANNNVSDPDFTKLNDGVSKIGETECSVGMAGTNRTHRIKFDLGETREITQIALKNIINSYSFSFGGTPAGNRAFDTQSIIVKADDRTIPFRLYKKSLGQKYAFDVIIDFTAIRAKTVVIQIAPPDNVYVVSLDEVEIYNGKKYNIAEIDLIDDGSADGVVNYAIARKGATYDMVCLSEGENPREEYEEYVTDFKDTDLLLLNDGETAVGETKGISVGVSGTGKVHLIKFDLGISRNINKVVLKNMINSANEIYEGVPAGTRGYDSNGFKLTIDGKPVEFTLSEEKLATGYANDVTLAFEDMDAQLVTIELKTSANAFVLSLDEVEICGGREIVPTTSATEETTTTTTEEPTTTTEALTTTTEAPVVILYGDVNLDGTVDSDDVRLVLRYDAGFVDLSEEALRNGDVNLDGTVASDDARIILRYDAGFIAELPFTA